jgi:hypothetical protein
MGHLTRVLRSSGPTHDRLPCSFLLSPEALVPMYQTSSVVAFSSRLHEITHFFLSSPGALVPMYQTSSVGAFSSRLHQITHSLSAPLISRLAAGDRSRLLRLVDMHARAPSRYACDSFPSLGMQALTRLWCATHHASSATHRSVIHLIL